MITMVSRGIEDQLDLAEAKVALLESRLRELERVIVMSRREFRDGGDPVDARAWLFRVEIDEDKYEE
jgi:hypothetical protein